MVSSGHRFLVRGEDFDFIWAELARAGIDRAGIELWAATEIPGAKIWEIGDLIAHLKGDK